MVHLKFELGDLRILPRDFRCPLELDPFRIRDLVADFKEKFYGCTVDALEPIVF